LYWLTAWVPVAEGESAKAVPPMQALAARAMKVVVAAREVVRDMISSLL
jgi:hypothetical protein